MTVRHVVFAAGAAAVLGLGVYLFFAVRSQPAQARVEASTPRPVTTPAPSIEQPEPRARQPRPNPAIGRTRVRPAENPEPNVEAKQRVFSPRTLRSASDDSADDRRANPKLDAVMAEANKAYDRGDLEDAKEIATKVLEADPKNVRMLRIMTSASCIEGENREATKHYVLLPPADRAQMRVRCDRYGVTLPPEANLERRL